MNSQSNSLTAHENLFYETPWGSRTDASAFTVFSRSPELLFCDLALQALCIGCYRFSDGFQRR